MARVLAAIAASAAILWTLARFCYVLLLPGVPDSGLLPTPALPGALWEYTSGQRLITTASGILVWSLSAAAFFIPPFVGSFITNNRLTRFSNGVYCACIGMATWLLIQRGLGEYDRLTTFHLNAWILTLSLLGFSCGIGARSLRAPTKEDANHPVPPDGQKLSSHSSTIDPSGPADANRRST
jgi:hypothetical protein